ncbi:MAG TPA: diacylglycerol kinase family protein, partial [Bacteroidetes bacterium]|nr:diacylglycerol kinase family protein [Bacteroidota bacterium]
MFRSTIYFIPENLSVPISKILTVKAVSTSASWALIVFLYKPTMFNKRIDSFRYAFAGIGRLFGTQPNARVHLAVALGVVVAGFYFGLSFIEWSCIALAIFMVLAAEAFNTALEDL